MGINNLSSVVDMAISGLRAQSVRMNVHAANIANIETSITPGGTPYRRQQVILTTDPNGGVKVEGIEEDLATQFKRLYRPGPGADADGYINMPNVDLPSEMIQMMAASRAYQANVAILKRYQSSVDVTLELLK